MSTTRRQNQFAGPRALTVPATHESTSSTSSSSSTTTQYSISNKGLSFLSYELNLPVETELDDFSVKDADKVIAAMMDSAYEDGVTEDKIVAILSMPSGATVKEKAITNDGRTLIVKIEEHPLTFASRAIHLAGMATKVIKDHPSTARGVIRLQTCNRAINQFKKVTQESAESTSRFFTKTVNIGLAKKVNPKSVKEFTYCFEGTDKNKLQYSIAYFEFDVFTEEKEKKKPNLFTKGAKMVFHGKKKTHEDKRTAKSSYTTSFSSSSSVSSQPFSSSQSYSRGIIHSSKDGREKVQDNAYSDNEDEEEEEDQERPMEVDDEDQEDYKMKIQARNKELQQQVDELIKSKTQQLEELRQVIEEKDKEVSNHESKLASNRLQYQQEIDRLTSARKNQVAELNQELHHRNQKIDSMNAKISKLRTLNKNVRDKNVDLLATVKDQKAKLDKSFLSDLDQDPTNGKRFRTEPIDNENTKLVEIASSSATSMMGNFSTLVNTVVTQGKELIDEVKQGDNRGDS